MKVGLDTSVVVRLLTGEPVELAERALAAVTRITSTEGCLVAVSDLVVAETYYALQFHYRVPKAAALFALRSLLTSPGFAPTRRLTEILETPKLEAAKPGFVDRLIRAEYLDSGAGEVLTCEKDAGRLPNMRVIR